LGFGGSHFEMTVVYDYLSITADCFPTCGYRRAIDLAIADSPLDYWRSLDRVCRR
jgi:hypothetical protein